MNQSNSMKVALVNMLRITIRKFAMDQIGDEQRKDTKASIDQVFTADVMTSLHKQAERRVNQM